MFVFCSLVWSWLAAACARLTGCRERRGGTTRGRGRSAMPDFAIERRCEGVVCGVDEAGRGPLAGPVVAAAVIIDRRRFRGELRGVLDDSKVLSRELRESCYARLRRRRPRRRVSIGVGAASVAEIDRINILRASLLAMARAVAALKRGRRGARHRAGRRQCRAHPAVRGAHDRQGRRAELLDRCGLGHRQGHPRPDHARSGAALSRLWLGDQCRLRDRGALRRRSAGSASRRTIAARSRRFALRFRRPRICWRC